MKDVKVVHIYDGLVFIEIWGKLYAFSVGEGFNISGKNLGHDATKYKVA